MDTIIETRDLEFAFGRYPVLKGLNLMIGRGEAVCLTGENGCGKSTALKLLIGALKPLSGSTLLFGSPAHQGKMLSRIGYVPQATTTEKISFPITGVELVSQGLARDFGVVKIARKKHLAKARESLASMGLADIADVPFSELSGGLQQRVLICRALINDPELLVLDEPISGVDVESRIEFLTLIDQLRRERKLSLLIVTHDLEEVCRHVKMDAIYRMEEGKLQRVSAVS